MIRFEKVSFEQFLKDWSKDRPNPPTEKEKSVIKEIYDSIKLPKRSTEGSAGYDFYSPFNLHLPGEQLVMTPPRTPSIVTQNSYMYPEYNFMREYLCIPTGIRFVTDRKDIVLLCVPRSGLGFKHGFRLRNTTGVIDADYCNSDNEGHIMAKIGSEMPVDIEIGKAFMQGIIVPFLTVDDESTEDMQERNGGFGSTDGKS